MSFTSWSVSQFVSMNLSMHDVKEFSYISFEMNCILNLLDLEVNTSDGNQKSTAISKQQYGLYH
ncbi:hypothetical protein T11_17640 [Trichinella zimbabwensis]|uniref:Uncharacterized protein n=1 Tax=Trichinella zimbabwensis TaxID=268475 RepID=A0A0V1I0K1_9BILA|nr:hypothetical protein T11_17640 [Trichinella zimbabwensis]